MRHRFTVRVRWILVFVVMFALVLIVRLYDIQIISGDIYSDKADRQYNKPQSDIFNRGSIYFDQRNGLPFTAATLKPCFIIAINPKRIENPEQVFNSLSPVLSLDHDDFIARASKKDDPYEEIAKKVEKVDAQVIKNLELAGVSVYEDKCRFYPGDSLASQTIGILGYKDDSLAGRYGLERYYEDTLVREQTLGYTNFFAEIFTNFKKTIFEDEKLQGDIYTSIELQTQLYLEKKLEEVQKKWSSDLSGGIILDPQNGEIIAMAVSPSFNPNNTSDEKVSVFSNPLVENVYEMGSIIKPLTMASGIDSGAITPTTTYNDEGFLILNGSRISNYDGKGRGVVDMQQVLSQSLNTGVSFIVGKMGNKKFADYFRNLEMGEETGIDLPNETHGLIKNLDSSRDVEYATASFGQGIALTPIETIRALATLANKGALDHPHIVKEISYDVGLSTKTSVGESKQVFKEKTAEEVTRMLVKVVDTALLDGKLKNPNYSVAAKTGTAQIAKEGGGGYYTDRFLHSFFGYFPAYDPKFIIFLYTVYPKNVSYASETLTESFADLTQFLINYYEIPPDR